MTAMMDLKVQPLDVVGQLCFLQKVLLEGDLRRHLGGCPTLASRILLHCLLSCVRFPATTPLTFIPGGSRPPCQQASASFGPQLSKHALVCLKWKAARDHSNCKLHVAGMKFIVTCKNKFSDFLDN